MKFKVWTFYDPLTLWKTSYVNGTLYLRRFLRAVFEPSRAIFMLIGPSAVGALAKIIESC